MNCRCGCRSRRWPRCRSRSRKRSAKSPDLSGFELKRVMRTGTVASVDNRNWEISGRSVIRRLSQSRAIALDMELAAIAANGYRFRVPYGTLLCVSDKPLHGEIKLAGMASEFYRQRVGQHLRDRPEGAGAAQAPGIGTPAFAQAAKLRRGRVSVGRRVGRQSRAVADLMIRIYFRTFLSFQCNVASSSSSGIACATAMLLELLSLPIHLFKDLLEEQSGLAPALAEPGPGMSPG